MIPTGLGVAVVGSIMALAIGGFTKLVSEVNGAMKQAEALKTPLTYPTEWLLDIYGPRMSTQSLREYTYHGVMSVNERRILSGLPPISEKANAYLSLHEHTSAGCTGCGAAKWTGNTCDYCGRQY